MDICFKSNHNIKWLFIRNSIMVIQGLGYALSQYYLPFSITLNSISPLFVYIYEYFLYGITINKYQFFFLMLSILGVILIANEPFLINSLVIIPNLLITNLRIQLSCYGLVE